ncbi:MAG: hypothetical protein IJQ18_06040 [Paludibacteraceae bacterium]|nr:hypothetical protein [Bacteroidales bacterium]MBQ6978173.1 hypothetical protein [Paludibacteraceae bacterium]
MANINFFDKRFQKEDARTDLEFGIYDPGDNKPAVTTSDTSLGQAIVKNQQKKIVQFVAIDHNMDIRKQNGNAESTCDGMLYVDTSFLAFVELKDELKNWISEAVSQLENTIKLFKENNYRTFSKHRAYAANKKHPQYAYSEKERMQHFKNRTGFTLYINGTIVI